MTIAYQSATNPWIAFTAEFEAEYLGRVTSAMLAASELYWVNPNDYDAKQLIEDCYELTLSLWEKYGDMSEEDCTCYGDIIELVLEATGLQDAVKIELADFDWDEDEIADGWWEAHVTDKGVKHILNF